MFSVRKGRHGPEAVKKVREELISIFRTRGADFGAMRPAIQGVVVRQGLALGVDVAAEKYFATMESFAAGVGTPHERAKAVETYYEDLLLQNGPTA
jgi:hypothetical protein